MTSIIEGIILGVVQGITEWLPISSSGHVVLMKNLLGMSQPLIFDIFLHLGSLLVVILVFWKDIVRICSGVIARKREALIYAGMIILATIPIGLAGIFLKDFLESVFNEPRTVAFGLLFTTALLFSTALFKPKNKKNISKKLTIKSAAIMGLFQACAIFPGVSRSGSTISAGLIQGIDREEAARFSFLLFIPAILGATIVEFKDFTQITDYPALIFGTLTTIIVGYAALKLLLLIIKKNKFSYFGWYTLTLAIVVFVFL